MLKFLDGPAAGKANGLCIRRAPLFLRVTCKEGRGGTTATGELDALDQVSDTVRPNETVYAYRQVANDGWIHVCRRPHGSGTFWRATYALVEPQPADSVMRSNERWQAWATAAKAELEESLARIEAAKKEAE